MTQKGVTLIEVLVALIFFSLALMVLANLQVTNLRVTRDSRIMSEATQLANDVQEAVQREVFSNFNEYKKCGISGKTTTVTCEKTSLTGVTVPADYSFKAVITGMYNEPADPAVETRPMSEFQNEGLIKVAIEVSGQSSLGFTAYLSCYDEQGGIDLTNKGNCPDPVNAS